MKKLFRYASLLAVLLFTQHVIHAEAFLEGFYTSNDPYITIELRETRNGFRVKRTDSNDWYDYRQVSNYLYKDSRGNAYYVYNDDEIEFRQRFGQRKIRFYYDNRNSRNRVDDYGNWDRDRGRNQYDELPPRDRRNYEYERRYRYLRGDISGTWQSGNRGQKVVQIRQTGRNRIDLRRNGNRWRTFYYRGNGTFVDNRNNRVYFTGPETLTYREQFGGFSRTYYKTGRRNRGGGNYCPPGY
ncbi:MAG: hypothetical protein AAGK97_02190 [Bacteroidota bacterium]